MAGQDEEFYEEPVWDPEHQRWEERYFGLDQPPLAVDSNDSGGQAQRYVESYDPDLDPRVPQQRPETPSDAERNVSESTEIEIIFDPRNMRPRPGALRGGSVRGEDANGRYRMINSTSIHATANGKCLHFANCRCLGRRIDGAWVTWRSNKKLKPCEVCMTMIHRDSFYLLTSDLMIHSHNQCPRFNCTLKTTRMKGCATCIE